MSAIPEDIMEDARVCYDSLPIVYDGWEEGEVVLCLARAILAERERHGWQPIETAPKDGSDVDLWVNDERATDFHMDKIGRWCRVEGYPTYVRVLTAKPTHWMNVPSPPKP